MYKEKLPNITPLILRHTFCTHRAMAVMNLKTLQYIMGHSDVKMTLDKYTHVEFEDAERKYRKLAQYKDS